MISFLFLCFRFLMPHENMGAVGQSELRRPVPALFSLVRGAEWSREK